ncbi:methylamine utilization protein [Pseudoxanthomonas sp. PXM01]|uniref:methylamine utilization protein n=1 Tax=Pseudoxanthomonas sp. PXM01 TaxID=2769295 RepID=UPI001780257A|nr:methylamine utilization protein [Pseudoxanthomonas sp. PXM01]MBD9468191.1 methylamine utilization protein [Pseudoxanthomonas sp. PXM01]
MGSQHRGWPAWTGLLALAFTLLPRAQAAEVRFDVTGAGVPVADAVISLQDGTSSSSRNATARMDQQHSAFVPAVLPVQAGTVVSFPNRDNIQHHVYSFSQPRQFQIPLYSGNKAAPIRFEKPGVVVVGCNIHDWMIGHIVVLDTPYFGKTGADGRLRLDVPPGRYTVRVWHVRGAGAPLQRTLVVPAAGTSSSLQVSLVAAKEEARGSDRLRSLQEKFRQLKSTTP